MTTIALESGYIRAEQADHVLNITIARADKRNALTGVMYEDLSRAVDHAQASDDVRVVCIKSEGDMFCAGNDIADFADRDPAASQAGDVGPALTFVQKLSACDKATVIAVQGQATGIGTTMLLHTDLVIAADDARFFTAFIDLALVPEAGSSLLMPARLGTQNANRLLLAGDVVEADEALRMGLVAYVVPRDELATTTDSLTARLAAKSSAAVAASKQLIRQGIDAARVSQQIQAEAAVFGERLASDEVKTIMNKFLKRK
ncbi:enoyl-CoA hydratase/isomerase family protein [Salinisphaera japonica]|uniref:Enoyl-CoA hydratase n=1 Tax=Salinisphaera japonica YTM-1 TaxID=1209778 RepID=A0A423PFE8_9GAMM|nr:enoyl-CoA hydratase-related protein [Salinisphaera japonica]ROO24369.1 enoyl-CoA hydratase [Salinisphaera japonica YTM-1]